jgi:hypothetical protein
VVVSVPHTPKTIVNHVAELRTRVRALDEEQQESFFSLAIARPDLCTKDHGTWKFSQSHLTTQEKA